MATSSALIWRTNPILLQTEFISLRWYGLFFACAFLIGYTLMTRFFIREDKDPELMDSGFMYLFFGILIGARLGHCFFYEADYYLANPGEIIAFWKGGLASHGAVVGLLLSIYIFSRKQSDPSYLWILSRLSIVVPLCGALVRLGNFFNSELVGRVTDVPWAIVFARVDLLPRHAVQLYECLAYFFTFAVIYYCYYRSDPKRNQHLLLGLFFSLIFGARFILEFFKTRQAEFMHEATLSMGQLLSIPLVLLGLYFLFRHRRQL